MPLGGWDRSLSEVDGWMEAYKLGGRFGPSIFGQGLPGCQAAETWPTRYG
jgi:hypothetical protein